MSKAIFEPLSRYIEYPVEEMKQRATEFRQHMQSRRTVRQFSDRPVPREIIEECLLTAGSAPNGANLQPWHFVVVSDPKVKHEIRIIAEAGGKRVLSPPRATGVVGRAFCDRHR